MAGAELEPQGLLSFCHQGRTEGNHPLMRRPLGQLIEHVTRLLLDRRTTGSGIGHQRLQTLACALLHPQLLGRLAPGQQALRACTP